MKAPELISREKVLTTSLDHFFEQVSGNLSGFSESIPWPELRTRAFISTRVKFHGKQHPKLRASASIYR